MPRRRLALAMLLTLPLAARAQAPADPVAAATFVRQAGVDLAAAVSGASTPAEKQARLEPYLERVVDEEGVARSASAATGSPRRRSSGRNTRGCSTWCCCAAW